MAQPKMKFIAVLEGAKQKTFTGTVMNTVYENFNKYCKQRGFVHQIKHPDSFGYLAWSNGAYAMLLHRAE